MTTTSPGFERFTRDTVTAQLPAGAPFYRPGLHRTFVIRRFDVNKGVRIAIEELNQLALNGDGLILEISGRERVVSNTFVRAQSGRRRDQQKQQCCVS